MASWDLVTYKCGQLDVNGGTIAYRLFNGNASLDSAPIVLVAGWGSSMNEWWALPQELAKTGRPILLFDNRGLGLSAAHDGKVSVEDLSADVLALADALLPKRPFVALGHSAGAFVAQHLAIHAPSRIAALICCGGQGSRATAIQGSAEFFKVARASFPNSTDIASRMKVLAYFIDTEERDMADRGFHGICERSLKENRPKATILSQLGMLAKVDYGSHLADIKCPALILHGASDTVIPVANAEQLYKDLVGSSLRRLKIVPGRHFPFAPSLQAGIFSAAEVVNFLAECEGQTSKL